MKLNLSQSFAENDLLPQVDHISLVILNIYADSAMHLHAYLSEGAHVSTPDPTYESALELFENTRLGGSVIWINAEGVTLDELALLEKQWLPIAGKAIMLMGSNDVPVINRSLQGLMAARRDNPVFEAVILTHKDTTAATTARLIASQSAGWLRHAVKNTDNPQASVAHVMQLLNLSSPEKEVSIKPAQQPSAKIIELPVLAPVDVTKPKIESPTRTETPIKSINPPASNPKSPLLTEGTLPMATLAESMNSCMQIDGAMAAALVDFGSGMALAKIGEGVNLDAAAAGNTEVLKAKMKTMASLGLKDTIEDVLITLGTQYHLIRPIPHKQGLFLYLVLDKTKSNLALARFKLMEIDKNITV